MQKFQCLLFVLKWSYIYYDLWYNLHDCTFKEINFPEISFSVNWFLRIQIGYILRGFIFAVAEILLISWEFNFMVARFVTHLMAEKKQIFVIWSKMY